MKQTTTQHSVRAVVKTLVQVTMAYSATPLRLQLNKKFRTIRDVGKALNIKIPPRKGGCFISSTTGEVIAALWFPNLDGNTLWCNTFEQNGEIIKESKRQKESPDKFQARTRNQHYDVRIPRIVFAKINGAYQFVGIFRLSALDMDNSTAVFRSIPEIHLKVTKRRKVTIFVEEETSQIFC